MAAVQFSIPYDIMVKPGNLGTPNGTVYFYQSGGLTLTPAYASSALTTQLSNPVVADGAGRLPAIYLDNALAYRVRAFDKNGALLIDRDPYIPGEAPDSASLAPYQAACAASASASAGSATTATGAAATATTEAGVATTQAGIATAAAGTATAQAGVATGAAAVASAAAVAAGSATTAPSDLSSSLTRAAWRPRIIGPLHPKHFGADATGGADDGPALQAFFDVMTAERWPAGYSLDGYFKTGQGLTIDGGVFGADITFALNFGNCFLEATAAIQHILTIQDCHDAIFQGECHIKGQGYLSGNIDNWTCDVGLFFGPGSQSMMPYFYFEGLGYAGLEFADGPNSDSCHWPKIAGQRVGCGSATANASKTANWSARADSGVSNSSGQYSTITVDALPSAYAQQNVANVPTKQLLVEISGQLCVVNYIDPATGTLRVYPWINASSGNSGTLRYHYGAGVVMIGGDSSLEKFDQIDFNQGGCVAQFGALFGSNVGILHGESNGSFARYGKVFGSNFGTVKIGQAYSEGNTFRHVPIALTTYGIEIGADLGADTEAKDFDCSMASNAGVLNSLSTGFGGFTQTALKGGHHFQAKKFAIPYFNAGAGGETIDFGNPATFRGQSFYNTGARNFTLIAPTATKKSKWGYDTAYITVGGTGTGGAPNGSVTFTPPSGHTINGGAADATAVFTNSQFPGPVVFFIAQTTTTDWVIYPINPKSPAVQTVTSSATVTPTAANDQVNITAQAVNLTLANPSGTAISAKPLLIRIKDNGTGRTITYGTKYRAIGVTLPTTTVANKTHYLGTRYNAEDDKWDVLTVLQEA